MKRTDVHTLARLQQNATNIRNICILAHVDHGKTTLADALLASNGIISQRLAGKLRYLDSREDEQQRGITMKSSAITLHYSQDDQDYLVNLIDSPGHIDFSSEVSTAVRLCDGAVVLVDVVEGVCPQTHAVLRQAWLEGIRPVLVLNKIDRLIVELKMTTEEAYQHLQRLLEQINVITAELFTSDVLAKSSQNNENKNLSQDALSSDRTFDWSSGLEDTDDSNLYFCPDQGNVVFASAVDGWGFRLDHFSKLYSRKVGLSEKVLRKTLWGDFYIDTKAKSVKKGAQAKNRKNLFVQLALDNIWKVYDAVLVRRDKELIGKIAKSLELKVPPQNTEPRVLLQSLFGQWLSLSQAVLAMVCEQLPSPLQLSSERVEKLIASRTHPFDTLPLATQQLKTDFLACSSSESAPVVVFVSKMFPIDLKSLPRNRARPLTAEELASKREVILQRLTEKKLAALSCQPVDRDSSGDRENGARPMDLASPEPVADPNAQGLDQVFIAFARVFSGKVRRGQKVYVLGPKHDPAKVTSQMTDKDPPEFEANCHIATVVLEDLYMFMGRELEPLDEIPAGNILGIGGLEDYVLKSAALSSTVMCPAYTDIHHDSAPIVRVAVYPRSMADMDSLVRGMKLLYQSDPCVEVLVQDTGEHVIVAAGEVHLQKCLDDLRTKYARVALEHSAPIIPFRETIVRPPLTDMVNEAILVGDTCKQSDLGDTETPGVVEMTTANRQCSIRLRAMPLSQKVTEILAQNVTLVKTVNRLSAAGTSEKAEILARVGEHASTELEQLRAKLSDAFGEDEEKKVCSDVVDQLWALSRNGTNILLNGVKNYSRPSIWGGPDSVDRSFRDLDSAIMSGFFMATQAGPLCEEPMMGVCFIVERWDFKGEPESSTNLSCTEGRETGRDENKKLVVVDEDKSLVATNHQRLTEAAQQSQLAGQLISCVKEGCRRAFQFQPQRLMWAMYTCFIQATTEVLGKMYAVLGKRNGRVLSDEMREGSSIFNITAVLPVVESFGFAEEIRKRTSGLASPQMHFSHWEVIDVDPYWVPTTEEEYTHFGEKADSENLARKYVNAVRKRKGLYTNEKLVEFGEKQRTLKKNK